ncbi:histidinol-phosphatase [Falsiroseomonas sp.]|uniref:histidinol-phosphatase n=1 Tax=Falsiroseomonas sp. TaxID=2870721 RepID=UPI00272854A7|nr:histidinol-phosphatase [Falsiroseomonas sp.]MDO9502759.1 histidinol-phosphatase [Falsiroseomonas sp.]
MSDAADFLATAEAAAEAAGAVIRPLFRSALLVEAKGDASPVTEADRAAERAIRALLAERHPDHGVIGEEYGDTNPDAEWVWVLDPIDGTRAFVTGRPLFGTLIGLLHRGIPVLGVIDQPTTGERWTGITGQPTTFRSGFGGTPRCRPCARLAEAELSCTSPDMFDAKSAPRFAAVKAAARRTTWGGDCYAYGLLALGLVDAVVDATMKPWDWAALVPVIQGAGGTCTDWAGRPLRLGGDGTVLALGDAAMLPEATGLLTG